MSQLPDRLLTVHDVAERWQVSSRTVRRKIDDGHLPTVSLGAKLVRIRPADVARYEQEGPAPWPDPALPSPSIVSISEAIDGMSPSQKTAISSARLRGARAAKKLRRG